MKRAILVMTLLIAASVIVHGQTSNKTLKRGGKTEQEIRAVQTPQQPRIEFVKVDGKTQQEISAFKRELAEAHRSRDRAALERMIAEGFIFIHSTGNWETRQQYIENAAAGLLGFHRSAPNVPSAPPIERPHFEVRVYEGHTAMATGRSIDHQVVEVYAKIAGRWRWVLTKSARLAPRPKGVAIDPHCYEAYVGQYEIGDDRTFTVLKEGDTLRSLTTGRAPGELIPKSETEFTWFNAEMNLHGVVEVTFIKDETGKVTHGVLRRDGQEVWRAKKIK